MSNITPVNMAAEMQDVITAVGTQKNVSNENDKVDAFLNMFVEEVFLRGGIFGTENSIFKPEQEESTMPFNTYGDIASSTFANYLTENDMLPDYFEDIRESAKKEQ